MASVTRRRFLAAAAATPMFGLVPKPRWRPRGGRDRLRLGVIGVANRGRANLDGVAGEDIVALCDVDARYLAAAGERFPEAKRFRDYRQLLELDGLDAVVISTPDHSHAPPAAIALRRGLDVYCEKPLTHTVAEARLLARLAGEHGAVTQMGTQIHALPNYRRVVERIRSGAIGAVREVHVFCNGTNWSGGDAPPAEAQTPDYLDWNLWLGPAAERPFAQGYHPASWRRYWDFGGGTTADMACHFVDLAYWALDLKAPLTVHADGPEPHPYGAPAGIRVDYHFPARGELPPVQLTWYDVKRRPEVLTELGLTEWTNGVLFRGDDGRFLISDYYKHSVGPAAVAGDIPVPPPFVPDSIGHYAEWLQAIGTRGRTTCPFAYSGPLTEAVLLGVASFRAGGEKIDWDAKHGVARGGSAKLLGLLRCEYRDGFAL